MWATPICASGELPGVGDVTGDGRADMLAYGEAEGGSAFLQRTSAIGKAYPVNAMRNVGNGGVAIWGDKSGAYVLTREGAVFRCNSIPHDVFTKREEIGRIDAALVPPGPLRASGEGGRVVLTGADGRGLFVTIAASAPTATAFTFPADARDPAWATFGKPGIVWRTPYGGVHFAPFESRTKLGPSKLLGKADPSARLASGHFQGRPHSDLIVGTSLWPEGVAAKAIVLASMPTLKEAATDRQWLVGDIDGNGRDDLVRLPNLPGPTKYRFGRTQETLIHYASLSTDESAGFVDTSGDGLLDDWKTGRIKPGGLDLLSLGARVGRRNLVVEFERRFDTPDDMGRGIIERSRQFFAALPNKNRDGSTGVHLLGILRPPTSREDHPKRMADFDGYFPAPEKRGVVHTFYIERDGPLVASVWNANGHINQDWRTFVHEIGHNFGLAHEGYWGQDFNALNPSVMSYAYSYSLNDNGDAIRYSTGDLGGPYSERALPERMPFPIDKLRYVSGGPYRFRIKADGDSTLVDWNMNGIFEDKPVAADITYSHGIRIGPRYDVGPSWCGPALTAVGDRLVMLTGHFPAGTPLPDPQGPNSQANLTVAHPGSLSVHSWRDGWAEHVVVQPKGVAGSPSAVTLGDRVFVAYPTTEGPTVREVRISQDGAVEFGQTINLPSSPAVVPTLAAVGDRLAILSCNPGQGDVTLRWRLPDGKLTPEQSLGFRSQAPVGAVGGKGDTLWVARLEGGDVPNRGRSEMVGFTLDRAHSLVQVKSRSWIEGHYAYVRPTVLWRDEPGLDGEGRLYFLGNGADSKPWSTHYLTLQVADPTVKWQVRRYYEPSDISRDAPGACWYRDDMAYVRRLADGTPGRNDMLSLGFYGTGASPEPIGDYDDVGQLVDFALARSIIYAHR